jgi:hypothetical protein
MLEPSQEGSEANLALPLGFDLQKACEAVSKVTTRLGQPCDGASHDVDHKTDD